MSVSLDAVTELCMAHTNNIYSYPINLSNQLKEALPNEPSHLVERIYNPLATLNNCYDDSVTYAKQHGGEVLTGWMISSVRSVVLRLVGHAVVRSPDGKVFCVSRGDFQVPKFLFIEDSLLINEASSFGYLPVQIFPLVDDQRVLDITEKEKLINEWRKFGLTNPLNRLERENTNALIIWLRSQLRAHYTDLLKK